MIGIIKKMLGIGPKVDLGEVIAKGAAIIDVRSQGEYAGGHLKNSVNIPLNALPVHIAKMKKDKPVITVCASGMRSASARSILLSHGFTEVYNGGSWYNLKKFEK